ncbi:Yqey-like protein-domain-containing protein [Calycina marina]|uniref:Altered inheritance of mitochondria protein 41 n=1 Tax=Calycina marina TaxID=1763456 RepID=A0A9P7YXQ7_9HELO|nr:Yqey-like protein-domain-containing protein [Calycina marina]
MLTRQIARTSRICCRRCYATDTSTTPPMLLKIKNDMKTAMRNRDSDRLSVLKGIIAQTLNASKTSSPITTDMQVLALLKKNTSASRAASEQAKGAGRQDLADKEECQLKVMEEYINDVEVMGEDDIRSAIQGVVDAIKSSAIQVREGDVLKKVFSPEVLGGKPVEKKAVAKMVKQILAES